MITSWHRLPLVVHSVAIGILVNLLAVPWAILAGINFKVLPQIPWSAAMMALYMWACWQYLRGRGWPRRTSEIRRLGLRAHRVPARIWLWCFLAFGIGWIGLKAFEFLFDEVFRIPQERFPNVAHIPPLTIAAYILMVAIVAGVFEEAGFRGYMQGPLEKRFGPWPSYIGGGVTFWLVHIGNYIGHMGLFLACIWYFVAASVLLGALAYLTGSILPGIAVHTIADAISGFAWWWQSSPTARALPQRNTMIVLSMVTLVILIPADFWVFRRLRLATREASSELVVMVVGSS